MNNWATRPWIFEPLALTKWWAITLTTYWATLLQLSPFPLSSHSAGKNPHSYPEHGIGKSAGQSGLQPTDRQRTSEYSENRDGLSKSIYGWKFSLYSYCSAYWFLQLCQNAGRPATGHRYKSASKHWQQSSPDNLICFPGLLDRGQFSNSAAGLLYSGKYVSA